MIKLPQGRMNELLEEFSKAAAKKIYKRIPYLDWKELKSIDECCINISADWQTEIRYVEVRELNGAMIIDFPENDCSFGEFLLNKIEQGGIMEKNDEIMWYDYQTGNATKCIYNTREPISYLKYDTGNYASSTYVTKDELETKLAIKEDKKINNTKENKEMKTFNFDFGPCTNNGIKMSVYGLAVKNANGTYVSYDAANNSIIDVDILNFDGGKYLYKMPVAIKDVAAGDIVMHVGKPMFVVGVTNTKSLHVVDPVSGEKKEIMLTRSPFGFDFATKIVNFLEGFTSTAATSDNPFGNMWMLMLASGENKNGNNLADILPFMLMSQGHTEINPMMMYLIAGGRNDDSLLPLMFMMNNKAPAAHSCHCNCHCDSNTSKDNA